MTTAKPDDRMETPVPPREAAGVTEPNWILPTAALSRFRGSSGVAAAELSSTGSDVRYGFHIGSLNLLIERRTPSEVLQLASISRIPNSPPWLLGMINLRSALVPVFDVAMICSLDRSETSRKQWLLVLGKGEHAAGLVIDGLPVSVRPQRTAEHLPNLPTAIRTAVGSGYLVDDRLWLELDHARFFKALNTSAAGVD